MKTVEAIVEPDGKVRLLEAVKLPAARRAILIVLDDEPPGTVAETALLSEQALAQDWSRPEENTAWLHLRPAP